MPFAIPPKLIEITLFQSRATRSHIVWQRFRYLRRIDLRNAAERTSDIIQRNINKSI